MRAFVLAGVPLIITNDGAGYLSWALDLIDGHAVDWPTFRTPGYSIFLSLAFRLLGIGGLQVLIVQHVLGVLTAVMLGHMMLRWARPAVAIPVALLFAIDPVFLAFECYALTETLSLFLLVAVFWVLSLPPLTSRLGMRGVLTGVVVGALCLVRPAFQVFVPFAALALYWGMGDPPRRRAARVSGVAAGIAAFVLTISPWVIHNWSRGIHGLSGATPVYLWIGAHQSGVLQQPRGVSPPIAEAYQRLIRPEPKSDAAMHRFLGSLDAWRSATIQDELRSWALSSVQQVPSKYVVAAAHALLWQVDVFLPSGYMPHNETRWLVRRAGRSGESPEATNFQFTSSPRDLSTFATTSPTGFVGLYFRIWGRLQPYLPIRVVLALSAMVACFIAARRGDSVLLLCLLGTLVYFTVHGLFLLYNGRYSLPCWGVWYLAPAIVVEWALSRPRSTA